MISQYFTRAILTALVLWTYERVLPPLDGGRSEAYPYCHGHAIHAYSGNHTNFHAHRHS